MRGYAPRLDPLPEEEAGALAVEAQHETRPRLRR